MRFSKFTTLTETQELRKHINELTDLRVESYSQGNKELAAIIQENINKEKLRYETKTTHKH